jgi:hypothetical protein
MKRSRGGAELVTLLEKVFSLETINKDVLSLILLKYGLTILDINNLCNASKTLQELCHRKDLWEKIYMKYVPNANLEIWRKAEEDMPNLFLRFISYFAVNQKEGYKYRFESPSGNEALFLANDYEFGYIRPKYKMPEGFQEEWEKQWKQANAEEEEDIDEAAEIAFNEQFSDENGYFWPYVLYEEPLQVKEELLQLVNLGKVYENHNMFMPRIGMERVFYTLVVLGWKRIDYIDFPKIQCQVCSSVSKSMCELCKVPICGQTCLEKHTH